MICRKTADDREAGPIVATIFVRIGGTRLLMYGYLRFEKSFLPFIMRSRVTNSRFPWRRVVLADRMNVYLFSLIASGLGPDGCRTSSEVSQSIVGQVLERQLLPAAGGCFVRPIAFLSVFAALGLASPATAEQQVFIWTAISGANSDRWLQGGNWNGPSGTQYPGMPGVAGASNGGTASYEARFATVLPSGLTVGIDMSAGNGNGVANQLLSIGGISFQNISQSLVIGNQSTADAGVLQFNGTALPVSGTGFNNIILSNTSSSQTLTIQNTIVSGPAMTVAIPSASRTFADAGATINISTSITGAGGITHYGGGTLVLSGSNNYMGGTVVEQGTLQVANGSGGSGSATGTGTVSVNAGAKLSGTGTIIPNTGTTAGNTVTVNGTVQPGPDASTGTLTVGSPATNATVSVNSGGTYRWSVSNVGNSSTTPGGSSATSTQSELVVNGNVTYTPETIEIVALGGSTGFDNMQPYSWRVATGTGGVSIGSTRPTFSVTGLNTGGGTFFLSSGATGVFVNFAPVPEPACVLVICAAAAGIARLIRRRSAELIV
jgi:autotransporter-associated beta strand protein